MKKMNKSWMAVVMAALPLVTLVSVVWAMPSGRPRAADITRKIALVPADFAPQNDDIDWFSNGQTIHCVSGSCVFEAPVVFPCLPAVTVERIRLHVLDNSTGGWAEASLYKVRPAAGTHWLQGSASSPEGTSGGFKTYTSADMNTVVWPAQKAYVSLLINDSSVQVYGVTVEYHRNI
jgi:hypothetical protein